MLRILARNIISNWCGFAVSAAVAFFLTPFVLHSLGDTRYGIWVLVNGLTGYYGMLDLGFRSGITQYLTRHLATRDFPQMNRVASTAFVGLAGCAGLIVAASAVVCWLAPYIFTIPPDAVVETRWCILLIAGTAGLQFMFFPFSAVFTATQRYDMANVIGITIKLVSTAVMVTLLSYGYGLIALSIWGAVAELIGYSLRCRVAYRILPELHVAWRLAGWENVWPLAQYGLWSVVINASQQLIYFSNVIVIGIFLPVSAIARFALALGMIDHVDRILSSATTVFFPAATGLHAQDDHGGLKRLYLGGSRLLFVLAIGIGAVSATWAADFFRLWVGPRFVEGASEASVDTLYQILVAALVVTSAPRIGVQVLMAGLRMRLMAILCVCQALAGVVLSVCLIQQFGLVGVAVGALIPAVVVNGMVQPFFCCRLLRIPLRTYLLRICLRPMLVGLTVLCLVVGLRAVCPPVTNWVQLIAYGACSFVIMCISMVFLGMDRPERSRLLLRPLASVLNRVGLAGPFERRGDP